MALRERQVWLKLVIPLSSVSVSSIHSRAEEGGPVGTFQHHIEVAATREGPFLPVDTLVDAGATYTLLPRRITDELGVEPRKREEFVLADGRTVMRDIAEIYARLNGEVLSTPCIIADDAEGALLGSAQK